MPCLIQEIECRVMQNGGGGGISLYLYDLRAVEASLTTYGWATSNRT